MNSICGILVVDRCKSKLQWLHGANKKQVQTGNGVYILIFITTVIFMKWCTHRITMFL